ncbi:GumC family protein [Ochrovirga pacifica]|uniref:GumC family protein n=1 Tax=Ochrovirga pacifica TaxID=1042376 RepID=UPI0002559DF5|nr:tyrosine-protein kinase [Ochrovirga pacifica]
MTEKDFFEMDFQEEKVDIKGLVYRYLRYWPLFILMVICTLALAFAYLKSKNNLYQATSKIQILDNKETPSFSLDLKGLLGKSKVNLDNEIAVIKSYRVVEQVVRKLSLNVSYYAKGNLVTRQVFKPPFHVKHSLPLDSITKGIRFSLEINSKGYLLTELNSEKTYQTHGYNYHASHPDFPIIIKNQEILEDKDFSNVTYTVSVQSLSAATKNYINKLNIAPAGKDSDLLNLSVQTQNGEQSKRIINTLVDVYEKDGIIDRQKVFKRTIEFVDDRFKYLVSELEEIEKEKKDYKQENSLSMFEADAGLAVQKNAVKQEELFQLETQLELGRMLKESLQNQKTFQLLPSNIGLDSETVNQLINEYNTSLLEYDKLKLSAGENNPYLNVLAKNLEDIRNNITLSINAYVEQLELRLVRAKNSQGLANNYFQNIPEKEKVLRNIERQQNLKESLYLLLLQKREESAINFAVTVSKVKVIDYAIISGPIAPNKMKTYLMAFFAGIIIPIIALYVKFLLDTKISSSSDIERISKGVPILSSIPYVRDLQKNQSKSTDDRSMLREAFRTLLTNLNFITPNKQEGKAKTLLVTSSIKGEGKTLVSYNLALELANYNNKVILVGADLRNPQLHKNQGVENVKTGLSSYLHRPQLEFTDLDIYQDEERTNLDILFAGAIPPNPTSLLSNQRFEELLSYLKKHYDYIVIDTAPTLLVSDTLIFGRLADTTIYVTRANHTEKNIVEYSKRLIDEKKLNNVGYVVNGVEARKGYGYGYGYKYEYGYTYGYTFDDEKKKKKWYHFLKR